MPAPRLSVVERAAAKERDVRNVACKHFMSIIQTTGNPARDKWNLQRQGRREDRVCRREADIAKQLKRIRARHDAANEKANDIVAAITAAQQNANGFLFALGATDVPNAPGCMQIPNQPLQVALTCQQFSQRFGVPVEEIESMELPAMDLGEYKDVDSDFDSEEEPMDIAAKCDYMPKRVPVYQEANGSDGDSAAKRVPVYEEDSAAKSVPVYEEASYSDVDSDATEPLDFGNDPLPCSHVAAGCCHLFPDDPLPCSHVLFPGCCSKFPVCVPP